MFFSLSVKVCCRVHLSWNNSFWPWALRYRPNIAFLWMQDILAHLWHVLILVVLHCQGRCLWLLAKEHIVLMGLEGAKWDSQIERTVCVRWAAFCHVWLYILYISNLFSDFEMQTLCSLSVAPSQCESDTALPPCEMQSHCSTEKTWAQALCFHQGGSTVVGGLKIVQG